MTKDKKCNGCKYLELIMAIDSYFATCNKGFFKNRKHISTLCYSPVDKPSKCKSFMSKNPKSLYVNFKPKKQQYIYVARDSETFDVGKVFISKARFILDKNGNYQLSKEGQRYAELGYATFLHIFNIKLKHSEQKRIRILVDKAEVVK